MCDSSDKPSDCQHPIACHLALGVALLLLACASTARALDPGRSLTQYVHRIWQMQQGLPEATIYSVAQTADGFLWLGTQRGVVRFDGVRFTHIRDPAGGPLEDLWVRAILPDAHNGLWLATEGAGLLYLKDGTVRRFAPPDGDHASGIRGLLLDRHGDLWAADDRGLLVVSKGVVRQYGAEQGLSLVGPRALCEAPDGRILVGGDAPSLDAWDGAHFERQPIASLPPSASVRALLIASDGATWIASTNGLVRVQDGIERRFTTSDGLPTDWVDCLTASDDGSIYAGTRNGFVRIRGQEIETFGTLQGLSQSTVYSLFQDREGSLWVGTKHGLNQFMDRRTVPFTTREGLASDNAGPVAEDGSGAVWVGTLDAGLSRFDGQHFSFLGTAQGLVSNTVYSLAADGKDGLWVGTAAGLGHLADGKADASYTMAAGLPSNAVLCMLRDSHDTLWIGTSDGLAQLSGGRFVQPQLALHASILALAQYRGKVIAAASGGTLYEVSPAGLRHLPIAQVGARDIDCLYPDSDGLLWIGSRGGGLRVFDGAQTHTVAVRDGLYDDDIYGIAADPKANLWFACSKGIFSVNRDDLVQFIRGRIKTVTSTPFSPLEGLRTVECKPGVQPAACRMRDGQVWFSTIHGALMLDPDRPQEKPVPMSVVVDDVIVNGTSRNSTELTDLSPGQSNVEFRYTALSFIVPTRIRFRYQLEGFDHDWVDAGTRRAAFYTNLRPGSYRFRVKAQNYDNSWSQIEGPLAITLTPHFYQRRWFGPLCAALLMGAAWLVYRRRVTRIRQRLDVVLTERSRIARELHDTLMQGFSGITMGMQALAVRLPDIPERDELNDIIRDAGTCLREARQSIAGLRTTRGPASGLAASIEQHARHITEAKNLRLRLRLNHPRHELPPNVEYNLLRIAQEAMANCVNHSNARTLEVSLDSGSQLLTLSVRDDGSGIANGNGHPGHYGLIGMRERAAQIGAAITIDSEAGRGTVVSVLLPTGDSKDDEADLP
jgi:signal transduction histidine kinase/ligand-binding sensor domain-containing protein